MPERNNDTTREHPSPKINPMINIVALISGNGSNLQAIIDTTRHEKPPLNICAVISNHPEAYGLVRARRAGVHTEILDHTTFPDRAAFDAALHSLLDRFNPQLVILAGYMLILDETIVTHYHGRMLNIHPSLLPNLRGLNTHQRALDQKIPEHGASVHFVTQELDGGPVIIQARVPVLPGDSAEKLATRVLKQEHIIYPKAVRWFTQGRLRLEGDQVILDNVPLERPLI